MGMKPRPRAWVQVVQAEHVQVETDRALKAQALTRLQEGQVETGT